MATLTKPAQSSASAARALARDLRAFWAQESGDWDTQVAQAPKAGLPGGADLWGSMPQVDSKAVARMAPIFEKHLKIKFDAKLIKAGGYESIDEVIDHLVPAMQNAAGSKSDS